MIEYAAAERQKRPPASGLYRELGCCESQTGTYLWAWCFCYAGQNVRKLIKDGFIIRKPQSIHSRSRARANAEAKSKGRHSGYGKS